MEIESKVYLESLGAYASASFIHARSAISTPFDVEVRFQHEDADLDVTALLFTGAVAFITNEVRGTSRLYHGIIEEAEYLQPTHLGHVYRLRLRPRIHELAYRVRTRIFQNLSTVEIVQTVLQDAGIPADACNWDLTNTYATREYCTQWNESELAFVSRLLEDEGIFYWFEHAEDGHVMHLRDVAAAHQAVDGPSTLPLVARLDPLTDQIADARWTAKVTSDVHTTRDWNWGTPAQPMQSSRESDGAQMLERYEYPGGFVTQDVGDARAADRVAEQLVERYELTGSSSAWHLSPGHYFALINVRPDFLVAEYVLTSVEQRFERSRPSADVVGEGDCVTTFTAIPRDMAYKPPRRTPKPKVYGLESAVVTGPPGEEIHVDAFGRIKVRFYWDREHPVDDTASCWIRVQQLNNAGTMILPRVGWEMTIAFLDGDPDRPVALQKTYNREEMPPYELPANKTQGALRSSSSPGGGGTNEIRMQDGSGGMELFMHAQKDYSEKVGNNRVEQVAVDATEQTGTELECSVVGNEDVSVGANQSLGVAAGQNDDTGANLTVAIGATEDIGVTGNMSRSNDGSRSDTVGAAQLILANRIAHTSNGDWTRTVAAAQVLLAVEDITDATGGTKTELVGGAKIEKIGAAKTENMGAGKALTAGAIKESTGADIAVNAGAALSIAAGGPIQIGAGGAFSIGGKSVTYNAPAGATLKAGGCELKLSGGTINVAGKKLSVSGTAQVTLKGKVKWKKKGGKGGGGGGGGGSGAAGSGAGKASKPSKSKGGKVKKPTKKEQRLAASPGNSPEQIAARKKVAAHHYQTYGKKYDRSTGQVRKLTPSEMASELKCIDYNQPVISGPPPPIPSTLSQYQVPGGRRGGYFAPQGTPPGALGIGPNGTDYSTSPPTVVPKTTTDYTMSPQTKYLQSTAEPCNDTWSTPGSPQSAPGGGPQYYVSNGYYETHPQVKPQ